MEFDQKLSRTGPSEDGLGNGGERDQIPELQTEDRDHGNERIFQAVSKQDVPS